jgi:hypothetical protein
MGDIGFGDKNQGLAYLVEVIVTVARNRLGERDPEAAAAILASRNPDEAARLASEAGLTSEAVEVLNEALGLEIALERLSNALQVAQLPPQMRSHAVSMMAEDTLSVAPSAVVDATRRTLEAAFTTYVIVVDKEARGLRHGWRTWTKAAKGTLSRTREPVAHAETFHMDDFGGLKIWEGAILLGVGGHELLQWVAGDQLHASHEALERRVIPLRQTATLLVAKVFAECGALAALIERRYVPEKGGTDGSSSETGQA